MFTRIAATVLLTASAAFAQLGAFKSDEIIARNQGAKVSATLSSILTKVGSAEKTIVIDGGAWTIGTDLSIPTNVTLEIRPGSYFDVQSGATLTVLGGIDAGVQQIFTGDGDVDGPDSGVGRFPYRVHEWGDEDSFDIGTGYMQVSNVYYVGTGSGTNSGQYTVRATVNVTNGQWVTLHVGDINVLNPRGKASFGYVYPRLAAVSAADVGTVTYIAVLSSSTNQLSLRYGYTGNWYDSTHYLFPFGSGIDGSLSVVPVATNKWVSWPGF